MSLDEIDKQIGVAVIVLVCASEAGTQIADKAFCLVNLHPSPYLWSQAETQIDKKWVTVAMVAHLLQAEKVHPKLPFLSQRLTKWLVLQSLY